MWGCGDVGVGVWVWGVGVMGCVGMGCRCGGFANIADSFLTS